MPHAEVMKDSDIVSLLDTLWVLQAGFAPMTWSSALESTVLGLPDLA